MGRRRIDFEGRTVLITGGSRGLGLLVAEQLGRAGAKIAICGRAPEALERAEQRLRALGIDVFAEACDISEPNAAGDFVAATLDRFGRIDVVINNAGIIQVGPLESVTLEQFHEVMAANFWGAVYVTLAALPALRRHGSDARIVNVTSLGARASLPHLLAYGSSKFALVGFSEALRAELSAKRGSPRVVTVVPGVMRTGSFYNAEFFGDRAREFAWFSVGSSLPLFSIDARRAARKVVRATADGRILLRYGLSSFALDWMRRISPRLTVWLMGLVARLLPSGSHANADAMKGRLLESTLPGSALLRLGDRAARANNEMPPKLAR